MHPHTYHLGVHDDNIYNPIRSIPRVALRVFPPAAEQLMVEKGKPEAEQTRYRKMLNSLSAKVVVQEAAAQMAEVQAHAR